MATTYGTAGLGESVDGDVTFHFCYQATEPFTITVNASEGGATISTTVEELGGGTTTSSSAQISLPASTFAYVKIVVTDGGSTYLS